MGIKIIDDSSIKSIADAIRAKSGTSSSLTYPTDFISAIEDITTSSAIALQSKTVTPTESTQTIIPDNNYDGLSAVTVNGISSSYIGSNIVKKSAQTYTPTTTDQTISAGQYLNGAQTIKGDSNLIAGNIASGKSIFGVQGTFSGSVNINDIIKNGALNYGQYSENTYIFSQISTIQYGFACRNGYFNASFPDCTAVNTGAFFNCTLISGSFPLCTTIATFGFTSCSLTKAIFPECSFIGRMAFANCYDLTTANFPKCKQIVDDAFNYCYHLNSIDFSICSSIGVRAFCSCFSLTSASFPSCTYLGGRAFSGCYSLTSAYFPLCSQISDGTFEMCPSLTYAYFPLCESIGMHAFLNCTSLTSISFPSCTYVGYEAFQNCGNLVSIELPNCTVIGSSAFSACYNLPALILPKCTAISQNAFYSCSKFLSLYLLNSTVAELTGLWAFYNSPILTSSNGIYGSIYVRASLLTAYKSATNWAYYSSRIVGLTDTQIASLIS